MIAGLYFSRYGLNEPGARLDPAKMAALWSGSPGAVRIVSVLLILLSILSLIIAMALRERMQAKAPNLVRLLVVAASALCLLIITYVMIGVQTRAAMAGVVDVSIYRPVLLIQNGIFTAAHFVLGWVALLIGIPAITTRAFPRFIGYAFLVSGISGVIVYSLPNPTPTAGTVISIGILLFALLYAVAMTWMGVEMLRVREAAQAKTMAAQAG